MSEECYPQAQEKTSQACRQRVDGMVAEQISRRSEILEALKVLQYLMKDISIEAESKLSVLPWHRLFEVR